MRCGGRFPVRSEVQASRLAPIESALTIGGLALTNPPEQPQEPRAQDRQAGWLGNRWWWRGGPTSAGATAALWPCLAAMPRRGAANGPEAPNRLPGFWVGEARLSGQFLLR